MEEILKNIVYNSKISKQIINLKISHPITAEKLPHRCFFVLLKKYALDFLNSGLEPRLIGLSGLRGTGKTTLMWQLANELINQYPIYFFNMNEISIFGFTLIDVMEAFQKYILKKRFNQITTPIILLFDEIHDSKDWPKSLKILYDEAKTAFIVCTGSSALLLNKTADLARRMIIETLYPFKFCEFITSKSFFVTKNKKTIYPIQDYSIELKNNLFYSKNTSLFYKFIQKKDKELNNYINKIKTIIKMKTEELVNDYIYYYNIPSFLLYKEKSLILESAFDLLNRVIYEDIQKLNSEIKTDANTILKLLFQLSISDEINLDSLCKIVQIKKDNINSILDILQKAELITILNPYSGSEGRIHKNKKTFFMSPTLRISLLSKLYGTNIPENLKGKLYEDIVVMYLIRILTDNQVLFEKNNETKSCDFIIETMEKPIMIEVGKGKIKTDQLKLKEKRYGILISNNLEKVEVENDIIKLPMFIFLLL